MSFQLPLSVKKKFFCRDTKETLAILDSLDLDADKLDDDELYRKFGLEEKFKNNQLNAWQKFQPKIWAIFDEPYSSLPAKVSVSILMYNNDSCIFCLYANINAIIVNCRIFNDSQNTILYFVIFGAFFLPSSI